MSAASSIESCFSSLNADLEADHEKRELIQKEVRQINELQRKIQFQLQKVHTNPANAQSVVEICKSANPLFAQIWPHWQNISVAIGKEHVEKFHHLWRFAMSQLVFMATLKHVLETHSLMSQDDTAALVVGKAEAKQESKAQARIEIDLEDYLSGLSSLPRELSRLCVNCVRSGNYTLPVAISAFVSDLYSGFRLLNLRNDTLRRKFDAIKYDVTRLEEVMYDVSVRKLGAQSGGPAGIGGASAAAAAASPQREVDSETRAVGGH